MNEELTGKVVLVNPLLLDDPADRAGQIAVIVNADMVNDDIHVKFDDNQKAWYGADALMVLNEPDHIYDYLENHSAVLSKKIFRDLQNIALLQEYGGAKNHRTAMEIAQQNSHLDIGSLTSLEESLELQQGRKYGR